MAFCTAGEGRGVVAALVIGNGEAQPDYGIGVFLLLGGGERCTP